MAWSTEISQLVTETEQFIDAVELKKPVLDAAANTAVQNAASAALAAANTAVIAASLAPSADTSRGHAVATEAIANLTKMQQDAVSDSERQASLAAGYALSTGTIVQQDLSGVTATALHRGPNAIGSMFIYDTSKDSDGGAWTEKCQNTSWYNEDITSRWLGPQPSELFARHEGGSLGPELSVNGNFSSGLTNWSGASGGSATIVNNQAVVSTPAGDGYGGIRQDIALSIGKFYQISWDVIAYSSIGWRVEAANNADTGTRTGLGSFSLRFQATTTSSLITIATSSNGVNAETATFDNFSIREVTPVTASNDYFQLTTDGKFYRLWKNLLQYTEDFSNGLWTKSGVTVTPTANPQEWYLANDGVGGASSLTQNFSIFGNAVFSIEMKADTIRNIRLRYLNVTNSNIINVDLETGTSDAPTLVTPLSDGFYRISLPYAFSADNNGLISIGISDVLDNAVIVPDTSKRIIIRKPQLEYNSTATTYEYKRIAGAISEVFRGNKRDFPRLAAIIGDAAGVSIYDITEVGRPMWMSIPVSSSTSFQNHTTSAGSPSLRAYNGILVVGHNGSNGFLKEFTFPTDKASLRSSSGSFRWINEQISARVGGSGGYQLVSSIDKIASNQVNGIEMTVLPDAPTDPVSGLRIPTIAVGTSSGMSVIRPNGTIQTFVGAAVSVALSASAFVFDERKLVAGRSAAGGPLFYRFGPNIVGVRPVGGNNNWSYFNSRNIVDGGAGTYNNWPSGVGLRVFDPTKTMNSVTNGLSAGITSTHNTGWLPGDIRRVYLSDTDVGPITGPELITNGTFDTDTSSWIAGANSTVSIDNGRLKVSSNIATSSYAYQTISTTIGVRYYVKFTAFEATSTSNNGRVIIGSSQEGSQNAILLGVGDQTIVGEFVATSTTTYIHLYQSSTTAGLFMLFDNISVKQAVADRSYKGQIAIVTGALTRTQVASGASLVGYSGWSTANYLQEPYSADLDFGTGEFSASARVNYVTGNPDVNLISFSDDLTNTITWVNQTGSIITVPNAASDGITSAYRYIKPNAVSFACLTLRQGVTGTLAWTIEAKIDGASPITSFHMSMSPAGGDNNYADFNLSTGTAAAFGTVTSAFIEPLSDNWYRCTGVATGAWIFNGGDLRIFPGGRSYVGDGVSGMLFARGRVRSATTAPTSHISTTGTVFNPLPGRHIFSRSHSTGPSINCGVDGYGRISAVLFDGTTTRAVTTTSSYNTGTWIKAEANYTTDGSLAILINGREVAVTRGTPLASLTTGKNLLTYSESFDNSAWAKYIMTVIANMAIAPDGTTTADLIYPTTSNTDNSIYRGGFPTAQKTHSVYAKAAGKNWLVILRENTQGGAAWFNLASGSVGTTSAGFTGATITPVGSDGWYRCSVTSTSGFNQNIAFGAVDADNTTTVVASGTNGIYLWGAQLESTSSVTSYAATNVAPLTIGNSFALDAPFPGSIALLKLSATVPTTEQSTFMYEQEKQLFRTDAISILPDATVVLDMSYDDATDRWSTVSATNESYWTGLVRNSVTPVPAGSYSRITTASGIELTSRITTIPGVDVSIPTYLLREDLNKRAEAASKAFKEIVNFDYIGGFTASTTTGSTAITSVANLTYPVSPVGARISGTGIPTNSTIVAVVGTTMYISAAATATATGVSISFLDFELPVGFEAETVATAGAIRREGVTADFTRLFDGFVETIRFAVAPGATTWVQIQASRIIS